MKTKFLSKIALIATMILTMASCSSDDDNGPSNNTGAEIQQIQNQVESGAWRITSFIDSGQDETSDFTGYIFNFNSDGTIVATNGSNTESGTWSVSSSNSNDESNNDIDFNIMFNVPDTSDFEDLNDTGWDVISHTEDRLQLRDVSGGNGGIDTLTFERN